MSGSSHKCPDFTQKIQPPDALLPFPFTTTTVKSREEQPSTTVLSTEADILKLEGTQIISSNTSAVMYTLSTSVNDVDSRLSLSSSINDQDLYILEYLGEKNALYIRPFEGTDTKANVYPGFGELKYGHGSGLKSMGIKTWTVRYANGKDTVLSCRDGRWIEYASGQAIAIERQIEKNGGQEEEVLEFLVESDMLDRGGIVQRRKELLKGLVVAAWVGRCWHSGTYVERNKDIEAVKGNRRGKRSLQKSCSIVLT